MSDIGLIEDLASTKNCTGLSPDEMFRADELVQERQAKATSFHILFQHGHSIDYGYRYAKTL